MAALVYLSHGSVCHTQAGLARLRLCFLDLGSCPKSLGHQLEKERATALGSWASLCESHLLFVRQVSLERLHECHIFFVNFQGGLLLSVSHTSASDTGATRTSGGQR